MTDESQIPCSELFSTKPLREWDPVAAQDELYSRIERLERNLEQMVVGLEVRESYEIRIEALRAAVLLCVGDVKAGQGVHPHVSIEVAKQFAAYLETGE